MGAGKTPAQQLQGHCPSGGVSWLSSRCLRQGPPAWTVAGARPQGWCRQPAGPEQRAWGPATARRAGGVPRSGEGTATHPDWWPWAPWRSGSAGPGPAKALWSSGTWWRGSSRCAGRGSWRPPRASWSATGQTGRCGPRCRARRRRSSAAGAAAAGAASAPPRRGASGGRRRPRPRACTAAAAARPRGPSAGPPCPGQAEDQAPDPWGRAPGGRGRLEQCARAFPLTTLG